ncbi:MAG: glycerophosphoryl diester phosphodiesterase membrane domain-containing protein [Idiomarina sp.]|nr:glycerophosphoryl diester phosphodiesterase membrane domain-containing protein [Idiomarina sp.]
MLRTREMVSQVWRAVAYHKRPLVAYHLYFSLLALFALSPLVGWLLAGLVRLSGVPMIGNDDLVSFILSPLGVLWLLVSASLFAFVVFFQAAGNILIAARKEDDEFHTANNALWSVLRRFPLLFKLAAVQVACHILLLAPVLAILAFSFQWLLGGYDIYFVINAYPLEFYYFVAIVAVLAGVVLLLNGSLYVAWSLALPVMLVEGLRPHAALKRSWQLVKQSDISLGRVIVFVALTVSVLPILFHWLFDALGAAVWYGLPGPAALQVATMAILILTYLVLVITLSFIAVTSNSLLLLKLYQRCIGREPQCFKELEPRHTAAFAWTFEALLVVFAIAQLTYVAQSFDSRDEALNIAHRGASWDAPENSLAAIEAAIQQGADYIELDVQQTADGALVLLHDRDLLRVAGEHRAIWSITFDELRALDAGSWFAPEFAGERVPTLAEAVELIRGRANLYLEIKTAATMPTLVADTIRELQRLDFIEPTVIAALSPSVLDEVRDLEPNVRTSLLVHTSIGRTDLHRYDYLALRAATLTPGELRRAHRNDYDLHVWTVNDARAMHRYLDMGVDGIITDVPAVLSEVLAERQALTPTERLLLRMRHWLW